MSNHCILIIRNNEGKLLQVYDDAWECWLFPNSKVVSPNDLESILQYLKLLLDVDVYVKDIKYISSMQHSKYSVRWKKVKEYCHHFYFVNLDTFALKERVNMKFFSLDSLLSDENIVAKNLDIISYVREMLDLL